MGPILGAVKGRSLSAVRASSVKTGKVMAAVLVPVAPLMVEMVIKDQEEERVYDRAFRLRHHTGQLRADRYSMMAGLAGALMSGTTGAVTGLAMGTLAAALHTGVISRAH